MLGKVVFFLNKMMLLLPQPLYNFFQSKLTYFHFYQNINSNPSVTTQKHILISYITNPLENDKSKLTGHTNNNECLAIIKTFIDLGYAIDLVHCLDKSHNSIIKQKKYNIIFGFGEPFYSASKNNYTAVKIVYLTELHPEFSLKMELERLKYFHDRHKKSASLKRSGKFIRTRDVDIADYAILMGNEYTSKITKFSQDRLYTIKPTGLMNPDYIFKPRDLNQSRKNFIWFGSYGAIHKGLDILIDVFKLLPEYNLFICGLDRREKNLFKLNYKNIHDLGFINIKSKEFICLMDSCSYVILPSCSEGMATAVLTCMNHGLIPIVTRECGIDLLDWGFYLDDYHIGFLREKIIECANYDIELLEKQHKQIFNYSREQFNLQRYSQDFEQIIVNILSKEEIIT